MIVSNAILAIIAGSDTTATALSTIMHYLLGNPRYLEDLRSEIEADFPLKEGAPIEGDQLSGMKMLNAVMYALVYFHFPCTALYKIILPQKRSSSFISALAYLAPTSSTQRQWWKTNWQFVSVRRFIRDSKLILFSG